MKNCEKKLGGLILLFFLSFMHIEAQQNTIFRVKGEGHYGWLLNAEGNSVGGEFAMELPLLGNHNWEYTFNFPTVGFSIGCHHLNDSAYTRCAFPVVTYFHYPIVHTNAFALNLKWGAGLAGQIPGAEDENHYFPLTGTLVGGLNMDIALSTRYGRPLAQWILCLGGNAMVLHDCHVGRNTKNTLFADVFLGLKYTPNVWPLPVKHKARPVKRILALEVYGVLGANKLEKEDHFYHNGSLTVGVYLPLSNAYRLGLAAEGFYNGVYDGTQRTNNVRYNFIEEDYLPNKIRAGVSLANEITMSPRANVGLHVGVYCFNKVKVPEYNQYGNKNSNRIENRLYTKLVSRFYITPKFFTLFEIKTHLLSVECAGVGFGWAMPDFGTHLKNPFARISFKKEDKEELRITGSED